MVSVDEQDFQACSILWSRILFSILIDPHNMYSVAVVVDVVAIFSHAVLALSRSRLSNVELLYLSRSTHYRGKKREG